MLLADKINNYKNEPVEERFFNAKCTAHTLSRVNIDYKGSIINCCYSLKIIKTLEEYKRYIEEMDIELLKKYYEDNACNQCMFWTFCTGKCISAKEYDAECFMKRMMFSYYVKHNQDKIRSYING